MDETLLQSHENIITELFDTRQLEKRQKSEKDIKSLKKDSMKIYYRTVNKGIKESEKEIEQLTETLYYIEQTREILCNNLKAKEAYFQQSSNINQSRTFSNEGVKGLKIASVYPILTTWETKKILMDLFEITWIKTIIAIVTTICTVLFGKLCNLHLGLLIVTILHFFCRNINDRHHRRPRWESTQKNIQKFFITYILVSLANVIGTFANIPGTNVNVFLYLAITILMYGEGVGIIEQLEDAGHKVPKFFKAFLKSKQDIENPFN